MIVTNIENNHKMKVPFEFNLGDYGKTFKVDGVEYIVVSIEIRNGKHVYVSPRIEFVKKHSIININGENINLLEAEKRGIDISEYLK